MSGNTLKSSVPQFNGDAPYAEGEKDKRRVCREKDGEAVCLTRRKVS